MANAYEDKQARRKARYEALAAQAETQSAAAHQRARDMAAVIPFGQPILVGHHSEQADRNYRKRIHGAMDKFVALNNKARHYEDKAAAVGSGGVSSDDPEAVAKLRDQLKALQAAQGAMKKANVLVRKNDRAGLTLLGFSEEVIDGLFNPRFGSKQGFPSWRLQNNGANIRRVELRIKELESNASREDKEVQAEGYTYREDVADNRVLFVFPGKPDAATRDLLKSWAFKWSPTRGAWVRQMTGTGLYAAAVVRKVLDGKNSAV